MGGKKGVPMSKLMIASLSVLLALGCAYTARQVPDDGGGGGATPPSAAPSGAEVVEFKVIEKGTQSLISRDTELFFTDAVKFERWYESHNHDRKAPAINFNQEMAVVVVLPRNTGGFTVNLDRIVTAPDQITVVYTETRPTQNMAVIQALTQPYFIATLPKRPGKVVFEKHVKPAS
jgi:PrcB C-terminal